MRILMATGGSSHSEAALGLGAHFAARAAAASTVVTVIRQEDDRPHAVAILARAREILGPLIGEVETRVRIGHPADEIIREAEEGAYDLILVGERQSHGLMTRFMLGSTAVRVVEHAKCPVAIAKGHIRPPRRILLCDSGAASSSLLRRFTRQMKQIVRPDDEVTVLHVMSQIEAAPGMAPEAVEAGTDELIAQQTPEGHLLSRDLRLLEPLRLRSRPLLRHGLVVAEILAEAREGDYDLVVIGATAGGDWRRILLNDLAHEFVVMVDRPLMVLR